MRIGGGRPPNCGVPHSFTPNTSDIRAVVVVLGLSYSVVLPGAAAAVRTKYACSVKYCASHPQRPSSVRPVDLCGSSGLQGLDALRLSMRSLLRGMMRHAPSGRVGTSL